MMAGSSSCARPFERGESIGFKQGNRTLRHEERSSEPVGNRLECGYIVVDVVSHPLVRMNET